MKYKQRGRNNNYPEEIDVWNYNERPIPDWIIDRCKVKYIDEDVVLDTINLSSGGVSFIESGSNRTLFSINSKTDAICFNGHNIFILNRKQLDLLYKEDN